ncbi:MAG: hypothetical protein EOR16_30145 [Mesorhizobium sp.]|uniref:ATP-binding protein n=1 Tax=Mesorhizobium sp. TaxID=1871066 RepID=UPI000FE7D7CE|nr:ATP-binding protein [Mesorhizobium sp.]RWI50524.1 MAG: hypothetical protein EOR16_30145 [Mesorhizobium sp.]
MNIIAVDQSRGQMRVRTLSSFSIKDLVTSRRTWVACVTLLFAALAAGLGYLGWLIQSPNQALTEFPNRLVELRDQEAKWDAEILSLQLGIAPNYDEVTRAGRDLKAKLAEIEHIAGTNASLNPLQPAIQSYRHALEQKAKLAEQIKASYAMLRNAATILPSSISDSLRFPESMQPIPGLGERPSDLMTENITAMMSFTISPSALLQNAVQNRIARTRSLAAQMSPGLANVLSRFLSQIEVVTKERLRGNRLMLALAETPTGASADKIQSDLASLEQSDIESKRSLRDVGLVLGVILVISVVALVALLWRRFAELNKDNRVLKQVNENVEEQLIQSAKLSALGQMVAGITHEINTPLAYVKAVFELIKERVAPADETSAPLNHDEEAEQARREELQILLDDGLHGLEEISTLIRTMKNFSRIDKGQIESFSIEDGIESALLIARPQLKYVADVKCEFDSVPEIMGSASQLRQVLLNLIVNAGQAMKAMDRRGLLTIRTRLTSSDTVQIDVCDNGPGIPEDIIGKIFDPFFTTKPVGEGTGMGLSICYRIVENHGGTIAASSKPGKGTIFTITLPRKGERSPVGSNIPEFNNGIPASAVAA